MIELVLVMLGLGESLGVGAGQLVALLLPGLVLAQEVAVHQTQGLTRAPSGGEQGLLLVPELEQIILQRK